MTSRPPGALDLFEPLSLELTPVKRSIPRSSSNLGSPLRVPVIEEGGQQPVDDLATEHSQADEEEDEDLETEPENSAFPVDQVVYDDLLELAKTAVMLDPSKRADAFDELIMIKGAKFPCLNCGTLRHRHGRTRNTVQLKCKTCDATKSCIRVADELTGAWNVRNPLCRILVTPPKGLGAKRTSTNEMSPGSPGFIPPSKQQIARNDTTDKDDLFIQTPVRKSVNQIPTTPLTGSAQLGTPSTPSPLREMVKHLDNRQDDLDNIRSMSGEQVNRRIDDIENVIIGIRGALEDHIAYQESVNKFNEERFQKIIKRLNEDADMYQDHEQFILDLEKTVQDMAANPRPIEEDLQGANSMDMQIGNNNGQHAANGTTAWNAVAAAKPGNPRTNGWETVDRNKKSKNKEHSKGSQRTNEAFDEKEIERILQGRAPRPPRHVNAVYATGLRANRIGTIKQLLRMNCAVDTFKVPNISWIGRSICEFHVFKDYIEEFKVLVSKNLPSIQFIDLDPLDPSLMPYHLKGVEDIGKAAKMAAEKMIKRLSTRVESAPVNAHKRFLQLEIQRAREQLTSGCFTAKAAEEINLIDFMTDAIEDKIKAGTTNADIPNETVSLDSTRVTSGENESIADAVSR
jgi:hypothetical protein